MRKKLNYTGDMNKPSNKGAPRRTPMISVVLFFFGVTLVYTGCLALNRDPAVAFAVGFAGLLLLVKPGLDAVRYWRTHYGHGPQWRGKGKPRKIHLKIVKSDDDKPTIH